ncbi:Txe/YoeB family addiction module toxin [Crocosphaera sp. XPORK-15E]|uniref:Txe/YoeB family addiction module toxin n=1 Tax=Crocosphaera sp. XPORK-15E TaxID=3110247 RepID=UPI003A4D65A6
MWKIALTKRALKDAKKISHSRLKNQVEKLIEILKTNPYQNPPPYEKLTGDLVGMYSRRINRQHRLVYEVDDEQKRVKILMMWSHYE